MRALLVALLGCVVVMPLMQDQAQAQTARMLLATLDENKDRRVSRDEWKRLRKEFEALDVDKDGFLVYGELRKLLEPPGSTDSAIEVVSLTERVHVIDIVMYDANRDGRLTAREYEEYVFALADQRADGMLQLEEVYQLVRHRNVETSSYGDETKFIARLDRSRDGLVSRAEFDLDSKVFKALDVDGSGSLTADEIGGAVQTDGLQAFASLNPDTFLERHDRNQDGVLSGGELPGGSRSELAKADGDKDGKLDRDEMSTALRRKQRYQFETIPPSFLDRYDLNRDGKVSRREFPGSAPVFSRMDSNGDGFISRSDGKS